MDRVRVKRQIQEAKINLIKMLSECRTEAQLFEVMKIKEDFMRTYCQAGGSQSQGSDKQSDWNVSSRSGQKQAQEEIKKGDRDPADKLGDLDDINADMIRAEQPVRKAINNLVDAGKDKKLLIKCISDI